MSYTIQKNESQILISIQDELTIAEVRGFRDALLVVASDPQPVVVSAKEVKRIDTSIMQVLHSLQNTSGKLCFGDCSTGVKDYLSRAGISIDGWANQRSPGDTLANGACNG